MGFSTTYANTILTGLFNNSYIALSTTTPTITGGNVTEPPTAAGYSRVAASTGKFTASSRSVTNGEYVYYPEASESWGTVTHLCIYDNANRGAGNLRYFGALSSPTAVEENTVPLFKPKAISITLEDA